jgi:hypothetical protein
LGGSRESGGFASGSGTPGACDFFPTAFHNFLAPSATFGAFWMTSEHGTLFSAVSQPIAMDDPPLVDRIGPRSRAAHD